MPRTASLSLRILLCFMALATVITLGSTLVLVVQDQKREALRLEKTLDQIRSTYTEALSAMVWNMGDTEIRLLLEGIGNIPDVIHVAVHDEEGRLLATKGVPRPEGLQGVYPLFQTEGLVPHSIGVLTVTMDAQGPRRTIRARALRIFVIRAVDLLVISLVFLWIIRLLVTRHLAAMASYAQQIRPDRLELPLGLPGRSGKRKPDELDVLVDALNAMRLSIRKDMKQQAERARMEGEFQAASAIQQSLIPAAPPFMPLLDVAFFFAPALEVSGDYFDFFPLDAHRLGIVVADASGKGISAALISSAARILIHALPHLLDTPEELLRTLNRTLPEAMGTGHFLTLGYLLVDTGTERLTVVSAGHDPFFLRRASGEVIRLKPGGYPFCQLHQKGFDMRLKTLTLSFEPGDLLLMYTDGLTESLSPAGEPFGEAHIHRFLETSFQNAQSLVHRLVTELAAFRGGRAPEDDTTLVALRFLTLDAPSRASGK